MVRQESPEEDRVFHDINDFIQRWIPGFRAEGRTCPTIVSGCTGNQHRWVYLVEQLHRNMARPGRRIQCQNREPA